VVAVVGDGALGCGVPLEGLNSVIETTRNFTLILNDNKMAIAPNVGALARYLNRVISGARYNRFKEGLRSLITRIPKIGTPLRRGIHRLEAATKGLLVPGLWFEELGLRYIGPLDGHDLPRLIQTLEGVRRLPQPLVVHVLTEKGRGYTFAERAPEEYHGLSRFDPGSGKPLPAGDGSPTAEETFSSALGRALGHHIGADPRVVAITAGMCYGTGLREVRERYPRNFFDVGIAEEHAVVFAAGLAVAGYRPILAVYATFMQRAMDYVFHDVCLQDLPVVFCLDRAGAVEDGPTHHGILDLAFWRALPNLSVLQPADAWELEQMLALLLARGRPGMIRYPKGGAGPLPASCRAPMTWGKAVILREGRDVAIWALGREVVFALQAARLLAQDGVEATVVNPRFLVPFDADLLLAQASHQPIVTLEDHGLCGGLGSLAAETLVGHDRVRLLSRGWPRRVVPWGTIPGLRRREGLDLTQFAADVRSFVGGPGQAAGSAGERR
jgi:1-deoxy-D-xylulose-5-phosphate synthase